MASAHSDRSDHRKIVFCLRRQIRRTEKRIEYAALYRADLGSVFPIHLLRQRLFKILLDYQLATFNRD